MSLERATSAAPTDFNVALNGYRGLCALMVFGYHAGNAGVIAWRTAVSPEEMCCSPQLSRP